MRPHNGAGFLWRKGILIVVALLCLAGCVEVQVVDTTPPASQPAALTREAPAAGTGHDLSIVAVDFDPPLDDEHYVQLSQSLTLLVAVENSGASSEKSIAVQARLSSPDDPQFLLAQRAMIASIAPGEIQVVRFPPLKDVPHYANYHLEVTVDAVQGENARADNYESFDIHIRPEK